MASRTFLLLLHHLLTTWFVFINLVFDQLLTRVKIRYVASQQQFCIQDFSCYQWQEPLLLLRDLQQRVGRVRDLQEFVGFMKRDNWGWESVNPLGDNQEIEDIKSYCYHRFCRNAKCFPFLYKSHFEVEMIDSKQVVNKHCYISGSFWKPMSALFCSDLV